MHTQVDTNFTHIKMMLPPPWLQGTFFEILGESNVLVPHGNMLPAIAPGQLEDIVVHKVLL